ncbi:MAG TPA: acetyl-CoA carboxylase biotin carboxyl carrier protein subunit [Thermoplasmata archaeon]|nr:acetyl-CoA carboxylase biotin carboxyl carrier protein subunit [Thermoplasmata archaeon]
MRFRLVVDGEARDIDLSRDSKGITVRVDGARYRAQTKSTKEGIAIRLGSETRRIRFEGREAIVDEHRHTISIGEVTEDRPERAPATTIRRASIEVRSSMPGRVVRVLVAPGARVKRGQTLLVLEAMKMQNEIPAPQDGVVRRLNATEGETIPADRVVAVLERR